MPIGLSLCVLVCGAAEQALGEAGAGFLRKAQPCAEFWPDKAWTGKRPLQVCGSGSWIRKTTCCIADVAGAEKGA